VSQCFSDKVSKVVSYSSAGISFRDFVIKKSDILRAFNSFLIRIFPHFF
ncbi:MAG: hypothetical protein RI890_362, partial [Actinomycetota bacterium]